ncbi:MAG: hypothetical protein M3Y85_12480, partial [Bacteroidota bacterium]|nr:hypothetical protein [Bacteroidota bacterium]
ILLLAIFIPYDTPISYIFYGILSFFAVFFFSVYEKQRHIPTWAARVFSILGDASYAIYLFGPIVAILIGATNNFWKAIVILVTICFSILFNRFIETNFLMWSRKILYEKDKTP